MKSIKAPKQPTQSTTGIIVGSYNGNQRIGRVFLTRNGNVAACQPALRGEALPPRKKPRPMNFIRAFARFFRASA